jgi:kumamolisin
VLRTQISRPADQPHEPVIELGLHDQNANVDFKIKVRGRNDAGIFEYADAILAGRINKTLTHEEFNARFAATDQDIAAARAWAESKGFMITNVHAPTGKISLRGSVPSVQTAFGITLQQGRTASASYRTYDGHPSIESSIADVIVGVTHINTAPNVVPLHRKLDTVPQAGFTSQPHTPQQMATAYNFPPGDGTNSVVALIQLGGGYSQANLNSTFAYQNLTVPTCIDVGVDGGVNNVSDTYGGLEVMLDICCAGGICYKGTLVTYFGGYTSGEYFADTIAAALHDTTNKPQVLSISWGSGEVVSDPYFESVLASSIILGIPVLAAAGDDGAKAFWAIAWPSVMYPASSIYTVAVGGTSVYTNLDGSISEELVWNTSGATGGGISSIFSVPDYQTGLTSLRTDGVQAALSYRGVPDIAANADPYTGYVYFYAPNNLQVTVCGTSAASPLMAGLIALCIGSSGKKFDNIFNTIYKNPGAFRDITIGDNNFGYPYGFSATVGWDACTGMGVPIGTSLYALLGSARTNETYPKIAQGTRPAAGQSFPRQLIRQR